MSEDAALEAQIRADPSDVATHLVYADLLQGKGDPYGELIVLQHELAQNPQAAALKKREQAWFERNYFEVPDYYQLTWQLGFVRAATIHVKVGFLRHAVEFLKSPAFKFLRTLRLRGSARGALAIVDDLPVDVDDLVIETKEEIEAAHVGALVAKRPGLRRLEISAKRGFDDTIELASSTLEELVLGSQSYSDELGLAGKLPVLRSLILSAPDIASETIAAVLDRRWPLERLGLFDDNSNLEDQLFASKVWPGLTAVGIEWEVDWDEPVIAPVLLRLGSRTFLPNPFWDGVKLYQVGQALRDERRFTEALACFERGIVASPDDPDMWLEHGNLLEDVGRGSESLASYRRGMELDRHHYATTYSAARWYRDAKQPAEGLPLIVRACKLEPTDPAAWHVRGQLELALGKPAKTSLRRALRIYEQAIAKDERDAESWFQIACVRATLGERAKCLETLAHAIALDPAVKQKARTDTDLDGLRDDPELHRLTV